MTYYDPEPPIGPTQLERIIRDLQKEVELLKKGDPKNIPWTAVPLINGWTHWNGAGNPAVFCRLNGIVHIQGVVNGSAATSNQLVRLPPTTCLEHKHRGVVEPRRCGWQPSTAMASSLATVPVLVARGTHSTSTT
jgi:hypothetical protein